MKPLPRLGGAVLLLLSTSGCAAVQSRFNDPARNPEQAAPARSSGWFGSRLWSRAAPTPASASSPASKAEAPEPEADRPTTPETEIWPGPQSSGRSRLLPMLGNRDRTKKPAPSDDFYPTLSSASAPTAMPAGATDRQVRPARDDEAPADALARRRLARSRASENESGQNPDLLPGPVSGRDPIKRHNLAESRGTVALEVEPVDLDQTDAIRGVNPRDLAVSATPEAVANEQPTRRASPRSRPRRESYLIATAASEPEAAASDADQPPAQSSLSGARPALSVLAQQPKPTTPKLPTTPSAGPPPPPLVPSTPSAGPPPSPLGNPPSSSPAPASPPAQAPAPAPAPKPVQTAPAPATPAAPEPVPAPTPVPVPEPEPVPTAQPGPKPVPAGPAPTLPAAPVPAATTPPVSQTTAVPAAVPVQASSSPSGQFRPTSAQASPSPQAATRPAGQPAQPRKTCWLVQWFHDLHPPAQQPKCQLPPVAFPTTYQSCVAGPLPAAQKVANPVQPAPRSPKASAQALCPCQAKAPSTAAPKPSCISWLHYGMASDFFAKVRSWRHGCSCRCHDSEFRLWRGDCKQCAGKSAGHTAPAASPQSSPGSVLPQSQTGLSSRCPVPRDLSEGNEILERIAAQGLDKTP